MHFRIFPNCDTSCDTIELFYSTVDNMSQEEGDKSGEDGSDASGDDSGDENAVVGGDSDDSDSQNSQNDLFNSQRSSSGDILDDVELSGSSRASSRASNVFKSPIESQRKKKNKSPIRKKVKKARRPLQMGPSAFEKEMLQTLKEPTEKLDEDQMFLMSLAPTLRSIGDPEQKMFAKMELMCTLQSCKFARNQNVSQQFGYLNSVTPQQSADNGNGFNNQNGVERGAFSFMNALNSNAN